MSQTTYSLDLVAAVAGQVVEKFSGGWRGRYEASESLVCGRLVEYHTDGKLRAPQGTTLTRLQGAVPYIATRQSSTFATTDGPVPTLRKGLVWVEYGGTAPSVETAVNVMHSSTIATDRGKVTGSATSAVAGSEITAIEGIRCVEVDTSLGLALIEIDLPA